MSGNGQRRASTQFALDFDEQRHAMVEHQIRLRGVRSERVLEAMRAVPRHEFVPPEMQPIAYADQPLPIGEKQTISQPFMVAAMTEALELAGPEKVLEVGTGSGYQAALLSRLAARVLTIEYHGSLAEAARERLDRLGCANVVVLHGDGTLGWPEEAPFDAVVVTAAAPKIPQPLLAQLAEGGRMVIPVGDEEQQELVRVRKLGGKFPQEVLHYCRFVPLVGRYGWRHPFH
jgi:protein-L-isoaspartate(D-aspartate) O-methyltransferase